ncbi:MAG TPA: NAD(P)/FAD-dependent oxidoreductase, partial [Thermoanaerobaculia bacterium]
MQYDAIIVGGGPNGLAAGIVLAEAGRSVLLVEANEEVGGGARSAALTFPGFVHDICSAIHPTALASPLFRRIGLDVEWVDPPVPLAHPLDDGTAAILHRSVRVMRHSLGDDGRAWERLFDPLVSSGPRFFEEILRPIRIPRHPLLMARFGLNALRSSRSLIDRKFRGAKARALFTGCSAHSILPLDRLGTASFGLALAVAAHTLGWPCARGGSQKIADALAAR